MITLISGTPGSGKTLYAVTRIIEEINNNPTRQIYSDIKGLKIEGVKSVPDDWRDAPDGSLLIYDECQYRDMFKRDKGRTRYEAILDLTTHRHTGKDIWLITQSPHFLHVDVLAVIGEHIHVDRPMGAKLANIYKWRQAETKPQGRTVKERAENRSLFKYDEDVFNYYDSVDVSDDKANHKSLKVPWILYTLFIGGALLVLYSVSSLFFSYQDKVADTSTPKTEKKTQYDQMQEQGMPAKDTPIIDTVPKTQTTSPQETLPTITKEQLEKQLKLQEQHFNQLLEQQRIQLIMQYDLMQKQLVEHDEQIKSFYRTLELYKTMLPKDYKELKANPDLQVRGVIKMGDKCRAINKDGVAMTLNAEQCKYYTDEPNRVWKAGQTTDNSPSQPRLPPTLTDNSTTTIKTNSGDNNTPTAPNPQDTGLNEATNAP